MFSVVRSAKVRGNEGRGAGAARAGTLYSEPDSEPEPRERFGWSRSWRRSRQKHGSSDSEKE